MSEQESDAFLFHSTNSRVQTKIFLKLLPNGHIHVDWSDLPKHRNIRRCVIHYKSLNTNRSHAIRVSRKKQSLVLQKIQSGHLYEVHVCAVDSDNRIIASSECAQIQMPAGNEAPVLRVTKSTPDCVWLEWEKSEEVQLSDIQSYALIVNNEKTAIFPSRETNFVVNDGILGEHYTFQIEMIRKDGKMISSLPISIHWPSVTLPNHHAYVNGSEELIICWGDSTSINDGSIQSYTLNLYDSEGQLIRQIGPNPAECRQVWIKDMTKGVYYYVLETKLARSTQSIRSKPRQIECGRESQIPILTCNYADADNRKQLLTMIYHLINLRDNMKSKRLLDKCAIQLKQCLSTLTNLTDAIRLRLTIQTKTDQTIPKSYQLIIDEQEHPSSLPSFVKDFPLELARRDKPYQLAVSMTPGFYGTKSKTVLVEASGNFSFFCAHFDRSRGAERCSYMKTCVREKPTAHQGLVKSPQPMKTIQVYDLKKNKIVLLPLLGKVRRLTLVLFYMNQCVPSITHLNYFSTYTSSHRRQCHYLSINCTPNDIDGLKTLTESSNDIQCYTDFSSDDFEYEHKDTEKPIHEVLSIDGVPTYFVLDFSGRIAWKGRLCVQNQLEYDAAMDHIISEVNQIKCSAESCQLCHYQAMEDARIESELNNVLRNFQSIVQRSATKQQDEKTKSNGKRRVVSMKKRSGGINNDEYH